MSDERNVRIHPTADVAESARIGPGTAIWSQAQVMGGASIGEDCILGKGSFVDREVPVGDRCKLQNYALVYRGATIGSDVFIGPAAILTNDRFPRASIADGALKSDADWHEEGVTVEDSASLGARSVIGPGVTIGTGAMVGAGSVVLVDVAPFALVVGNPARQIGHVCLCGHRVTEDPPMCSTCGRTYRIVGEGLALET